MESISDNEHVVVRIEMSGLDPEQDVRLELRDQELDISVQHVDGGSSEQVSHRVALPHPVDEGDIERSYRDGVLEIRVNL